ncbi:hypothetical protein APSETT444_010374 [Aspergillus pseudonomiae]
MAASSGNWSGWSALSDTVHKLPLLPSPFDLLHGSRRNWLADQINRLLRRVRWPSSVSIWDWDDDENMFVKPEFFETFLDRSGWGLTSVFIDKYPELVKGMDVEGLRYDVP